MRVTYRVRDTRTYWEERWSSIPADAPAENRDVYPLRYAELTIGSREGRILEAGCGNGRVLRFYKERGYDIVGMDYIRTALDKLAGTDPELLLGQGDIRDLCYADASFRYVLAFGLFHNLDPRELGPALRETLRVMEPGGRLCASFRADNLHNRLIDWRTGKPASPTDPRQFHKVNLTRAELVGQFQAAGFRIEQLHAVENMPFLYRFQPFRAPGHRQWDESRGRREGYRLSAPGARIQKMLMKGWKQSVL